MEKVLVFPLIAGCQVDFNIQQSLLKVRRFKNTLLHTFYTFLSFNDTLDARVKMLQANRSGVIGTGVIRLLVQRPVVRRVLESSMKGRDG